MIDQRTRIENNVIKIPESGCWIWDLGLSPLGYGRIFFQGKARFAHRVAYTLFKGAVPEGKELDHKCRIRCCVNPDHLDPITHAENVKRGARGALNPQRKQTHCKHGHEFTDQNTYWKNTPTGSKTRMCIACKDKRSLEFRKKRSVN